MHDLETIKHLNKKPKVLSEKLEFVENVLSITSKAEMKMDSPVANQEQVLDEYIQELKIFVNNW